MKKIVTTILGASLLASAVYAANMNGMTKMNSMNHSNMSKEECLSMHKEFHNIENKKAKVSSISKDLLDKLYPQTEEN